MVTRLFRRTSGYTTLMEHMAIISYVYVLSVQFNMLRTYRVAMAQKKLTLRKKNSEYRLYTISLQRPNEL